VTIRRKPHLSSVGGPQAPADDSPGRLTLFVDERLFGPAALRPHGPAPWKVRAATLPDGPPQPDLVPAQPVVLLPRAGPTWICRPRTLVVTYGRFLNGSDEQ
jgi:hypothetical protein